MIRAAAQRGRGPACTPAARRSPLPPAPHLPASLLASPTPPLPPPLKQVRLPVGQLGVEERERPAEVRRCGAGQRRPGLWRCRRCTLLPARPPIDRLLPCPRASPALPRPRPPPHSLLPSLAPLPSLPSPVSYQVREGAQAEEVHRLDPRDVPAPVGVQEPRRAAGALAGRAGLLAAATLFVPAR